MYKGRLSLSKNDIVKLFDLPSDSVFTATTYNHFTEEFDILFYTEKQVDNVTVSANHPSEYIRNTKLDTVKVTHSKGEVVIASNQLKNLQEILDKKDENNNDDPRKYVLNYLVRNLLNWNSEEIAKISDGQLEKIVSLLLNNKE